MMRFMVVVFTVLIANPLLAEKGARVSLENILTGPAVGTASLYAIQLEMEVVTLGPVDIGWSFRKEGPGSVDGWGFGVHASRDWLGEKKVSLVTQAGVRFFGPGVEYSTFQYVQNDGVVVWQKWDRISSNYHFPFGGPSASVGGSGAWAPNIGVFAQCDTGPVTVRVGVRATMHRYGVEVLHRPPGGDLLLSRDDKFFRVIFAPTIAIGF